MDNKTRCFDERDGQTNFARVFEVAFFGRRSHGWFHVASALAPHSLTRKKQTTFVIHLHPK